jgi:hypothetical protein
MLGRHFPGGTSAIGWWDPKVIRAGMIFFAWYELPDGVEDHKVESTRNP